MPPKIRDGQQIRNRREKAFPPVTGCGDLFFNRLSATLGWATRPRYDIYHLGKTLD